MLLNYLLIRLLLSIVVANDLDIEKMDVKTTFFLGDLKEEIYMQQSRGFEVRGKEHLVCSLKQSL